MQTSRRTRIMTRCVCAMQGDVISNFAIQFGMRDFASHSGNRATAVPPAPFQGVPPEIFESPLSAIDGVSCDSALIHILKHPHTPSTLDSVTVEAQLGSNGGRSPRVSRTSPQIRVPGRLPAVQRRKNTVLQQFRRLVSTSDLPTIPAVHALPSAAPQAEDPSSNMTLVIGHACFLGFTGCSGFALSVVHQPFSSLIDDVYLDLRYLG